MAIDTSCDETSAAVTDEALVLSNVISSQINIHQKYGGVFPALAKRAHEERIDLVVREALGGAKRNMQAGQNGLRLASCVLPLSAVAVTYGPGLAIALEVGIKKAKELLRGSDPVKGQTLSVPLIAINHLEGHIYSCLAQNLAGKPTREILFPALCLIVSGGHTELILMKNHGEYQLLGETLDDACGEALDKAAKILKLGYPGGPIIERLAESLPKNPKFAFQRNSAKQAIQNSKFALNQPLREKNNLNFSYSGLKTQFLYLTQKMSEKELGQNLAELASVFQQAAFEQLLRKTAKTIELYGPKTLVCGGGVMANQCLKRLLRKLAKENDLPVFFPPNKKLTTDNAAMIGVAAYFKYQRGEFVKNPEALDRQPRLSL